MNLTLLFLALYAAGLILLGLWIGHRVRSSSTFFVADRKLGGVFLFGTLLAANIGAGSTVGAAGLGYRDGFQAWWWVGSAGLGSLLLAGWVGPRIWTLARRHEFQTLGDFLEWRYGPSVRGLTAAVLWIGTVAILAGQLIAMAWVLAAVAGVPKTTGCLVGGLVVVLYFTAGGLLSTVWVNLVQLGVLLVGFSLALLYGWNGEVWGMAAPAEPFFGPRSWHYLFLLAPAFAVSPGLIQKIYGARDRRTVRRATLCQGLFLLLFASVPALLGMLARTGDPGLADPELALPSLLTHALPPLVGGLGLAAIVSAEISSADALLFMLATSVSRDLYGRFLHPAASDEQLLRAARLAAIAGGVLSVVCAIVLPTVIDALTIFYSLLTVSLFVPVIWGLASARPRGGEGPAIIGTGLACMSAAFVYSSFGFFLPVGPELIGLLGSGAGLLASRLKAGRLTG